MNIIKQWLCKGIIKVLAIDDVDVGNIRKEASKLARDELSCLSKDLKALTVDGVVEHIIDSKEVISIVSNVTEKATIEYARDNRERDFCYYAFNSINGMQTEEFVIDFAENLKEERMRRELERIMESKSYIFSDLSEEDVVSYLERQISEIAAKTSIEMTAEFLTKHRAEITNKLALGESAEHIVKNLHRVMTDKQLTCGDKE